MPTEEFWHGRLTLISAYEKAYIRRTSYLAYNVASYMKNGFELAQSNVWSGKKHKYMEMPVYKDPIKKPLNITVENIETKHRNLMAENMAFLERKDRSVTSDGIFSGKS